MLYFETRITPFSSALFYGAWRFLFSALMLRWLSFYFQLSCWHTPSDCNNWRLLDSLLPSGLQILDTRVNGGIQVGVVYLFICSHVSSRYTVSPLHTFISHPRGGYNVTIPCGTWLSSIFISLLLLLDSRVFESFEPCRSLSER